MTVLFQPRGRGAGGRKEVMGTSEPKRGFVVPLDAHVELEGDETLGPSRGVKEADRVGNSASSTKTVSGFWRRVKRVDSVSATVLT